MRWNAFGTPATLRSYTGPLAEGLPGDAVEVARTWVSQNRELFGLSELGIANLELIYNAPIGSGHSILFRQRFGDLPAGHDGLLAIAVHGSQVVYVSSSIASDRDAPSPATLSAADALRAASADAGHQLDPDQIRELAEKDGRRTFAVEGFS